MFPICVIFLATSHHAQKSADMMRSAQEAFGQKALPARDLPARN
ncbi:hypothetical protein EIO_2927 (plasmid) [Ketogulonicigenium vulgare Y25]|uniref:Uncharacterized protein n=1 Tax=Ketogulonicigenium vulgare (strain WSH-001) TaxID=759362 RepID=F9YAX0_KETVW|nr:hypothetical protein EIO_2927 [Ketogulonicigenium vulgare Y25]AEM42522.1 hypothetical protein KVU_PA0102 [Ketogulonicigenium vulgare WSH-001]ALJ82561.1 hypothetical protein KVH_14745 [Ketogulonicigenium vulgare]ANW35426.1 hypothetical protein KvSKV_14640 [Ketogulonicigenium vulgare]AOZ53227.1 hypothetical protein KVC_0201 [Ketogulonicigenium vulgare]